MANKYYGTGRRKKSVARVYLVPGTGKITINKRDIDEYFGFETLKTIVRQPLTALEAEGKYDVLPLSVEILSDFTTPIEALKILKNASDHVYMLESAQANETWGRYTFLGYDPKLSITHPQTVRALT